MDEAGRDKLWQQYSKTHDTELRDELILEYAQLVKLVAGRLSMYLGYNVEYDDLVGYGIFGLIDAIDKYDYGKNVKFETYASLRIRGAILDQIRKMDWIPRSLRQKQKKINAAMAAIEAKTGRTSTDEELAAELGISIEELNNWQGQTKMSNLISLADDDNSNIFLFFLFSRYIKKLSETNERNNISTKMYYFFCMYIFYLTYRNIFNCLN